MDLHINELTNLIGKWIKNAEGETLGKIDDVLVDSERQIAEYLVLQCDKLFGSGFRYFAIPACPKRVHMNQAEEITLKVNKEALPLTRGVRADKCPRYNPNIPSDTIFELYEYERVQLSRIN